MTLCLTVLQGEFTHRFLHPVPLITRGPQNDVAPLILRRNA